MLERIERVIKLDRSVFGEIARNEALTSEAFVIVLVTSFLSALGGGFAGRGPFFRGFFSDLISGIVVGWLLWALITLLIGTKVFNGQADYPEMLRVLGYANAPRLIGVLQIIPVIGWLFTLAGAILSLIAAFLAIREALGLDDSKTAATVVIGWLILLVLLLIF